MLSAPFLATTYAISETGFLPLFFRIPWKSQKKKPALTLKEKRQAKKAKKSAPV